MVIGNTPAGPEGPEAGWMLDITGGAREREKKTLEMPLTKTLTLGDAEITLGNAAITWLSATMRAVVLAITSFKKTVVVRLDPKLTPLMVMSSPG